MNIRCRDVQYMQGIVAHVTLTLYRELHVYYILRCSVIYTIKSQKGNCSVVTTCN